MAEFLGTGSALGQPGLVIATLPHRESLLNELRARDIDVDQIQAAGDLLMLDAREVLATFMPSDCASSLHPAL